MTDHLITMRYSLILLSFKSAALAAPWAIGNTVQTNSGPIEGHASSWKPQVSEYLGVPFAQPPVGDLRFAAPKPYKGDKKIVAADFGYACPENVGGKANRSPNSDVNEDCLTLNIWSKPQSGAKSKPVMIWIYGGGFNSGRSSTPAYNGARLADEHDVVVVSINYRVNIFGFPRAPFLPDSNLGLLDQRLGIEWTRDK